MCQDTGVLTTSIGSWPGTDTERALDWAFSLDVPALPELPELHASEALVGQTSGAFPAAWRAFLDRLRQAPPKADWLKVQRTGPLTLQRGAGLSAAEAIDRSLRQIDAFLTELRPLRLKTLFLLDEPMLGAQDEDFQWLSGWLDPLSDEYPDILFGIHCCGKKEVAVWMLEQEWPALSFDLGVFGPGYVSTAVWSAVERRAKRDQLTLIGIPQGWAGQLPRLPDCVWVTPSCGLAGFRIDKIESYLAQIRALR